MTNKEAIEYFKKTKEERIATWNFYNNKNHIKFTEESKKQIEICDTVIQALENEQRRKELIEKYEDAIEKDKGIGSNEIRLWTGALKALKGCEVSE